MRSECRTLIRCQYPRRHDFAIRDGEGCFFFLLELAQRTVADRTEGSSRCAVGVECGRAGGTEVDWRHVAFQRESPRQGIASCATTPNRMTARAASSTYVRGMRRHVMPRFGCAFLHSRHCRNIFTAEQGGDAPKRIGHVHTFDKVYRLFGAQLCNRSAKRECTQLIVSIAYRRKYHKVNKTITKIELFNNKIGDAGAVAFGRKSEGHVCDVCSSGSRDTVLMASVSAHSQETFCHLPRNSVGMLFPEVFCVDVCQLRGVALRLVRPDVTRSPRACVRVNRFDWRSPPTFLSSVAGAHAELSLACATHVINVSRTGHCERHRGVPRLLSENGVHIRGSTFVRVGSERSPWAWRGAGSAHGHCSEQDRHRARGLGGMPGKGERT